MQRTNLGQRFGTGIVAFSLLSGAVLASSA